MVTLPTGVWMDRIGSARLSGRVSATDLFAESPVVLLERAGD
jgi:hypothetical protein